MRPIWSEFYYFLAGYGVSPRGTKMRMLTLEQVAIDPNLLRKVYQSINGKSRRDKIMMKKLGFTGVKWDVVKYERYEGEVTEVYNSGSGFYYWLEDEKIPPYLLL